MGIFLKIDWGTAFQIRKSGVRLFSKISTVFSFYFVGFRLIFYNLLHMVSSLSFVKIIVLFVVSINSEWADFSRLSSHFPVYSPTAIMQLFIFPHSFHTEGLNFEMMKQYISAHWKL